MAAFGSITARDGVSDPEMKKETQECQKTIVDRRRCKLSLGESIMELLKMLPTHGKIRFNVRVNSMLGPTDHLKC